MIPASKQGSSDQPPTESQLLFEKFCADHVLDLKPIPTSTHKTPDYELAIRGQVIVVEVKQLGLSAEDRRQLKRLREQGETEYPPMQIGRRVTSAIKEAIPQLRFSAKGKCPAVLVLYELEAVIGSSLESYEIKAGMYGLETVQIGVPREPGGRPFLAGHGVGKERRLAANRNTTLSAVARLSGDRTRPVMLDFFHNYYAAIRLDAELLRLQSVRHFHIEQAPDSFHFPEWVEF